MAKQTLILMWTTPDMPYIDGCRDGQVTGICMGTVEADVDDDDDMMGVCAAKFVEYYGLSDEDMEEVAMSPLQPDNFLDPRTVYMIDFEGDTYYLLRNEAPVRD